MTINGWVQIILYCAIVVALVKPLGWYMTCVFNGERTFLSPVLRPIELGFYRLAGTDEKREQDWLTYTIAMLLFHVGGFAILYALLRLQQALPFNPQDCGRAARSLVQHSHQLSHQHQLHTGECERVDDDLAGIAVHIGARVAALAALGETLVSQTVRDLVAGSGLTFEERGTHALKGVPDEWRLYRAIVN